MLSRNCPAQLVARALTTSLLCSLFLLSSVLAGTHAWARATGDGLPLAFPSYPELAAAVRQRSDGKSATTPAIDTLARALTAGRTDAHARALALSDWVRLHVRRTDARLRLDGPAPRPAAAVLDTRQGNTEELVVLLRSLLAASGIDGTAALVSSSGGDALPDTPMAAAFDHMLVHVPGLGLYLDPATQNVAAGYLPPALLGKPALVLEGGRFAMTPMTQPQSVRSSATVDIGRDGLGSIKLDRTYGGALAEPARLVAKGARGKTPDRAAGDDAFRVQLPALSRHFASLSGKRGLPTSDPAWSTVVDALAGMPWDSVGSGVSSRNAACPAVDAADETRYVLPKRVRILALPAPVSVIRGGVFYRAAYERQGNAVLVKRRLTFRSGRPTCSAAEVRDLQPALGRIERDLRSRITVVGP
jgi:hypothetical protein